MNWKRNLEAWVRCSSSIQQKRRISDDAIHSATWPLLLTSAAIVLHKNVFPQPPAAWIKKRWPWLLVTDSRTASKAAAWSGLKIALCSSTKVAISSILYCSACKRGLGILWAYCCCGSVTNFIQSYLHQFFDDSHGLKASLKPLRRPFDRCQSRLEAINNGWDIKQINW